MVFHCSELDAQRLVRQVETSSIDIDDEDIRISSNGLNGSPISYHDISPLDDRAARLAADRAIINQIGKPIVPLPNTPSWYEQRAPVASANQPRWFEQIPGPGRDPNQNKVRKPPLSQTKPWVKSDAPEKVDTKQAPPNPTRANVIASNIRQKAPPPAVTCNWMSSDEIKNLALPTNELVVRDAIGGPTYIIRFRAHIKLKDNAYFPLRNIQSHLYLRRVFQQPNNLADSRHQWTRQEIKLLESEALLHRNMTYSHNWLEEEIIILVDCGYLIIEVLNDGMFLLVNSISFYKSSNPSSGSYSEKFYLHRQTHLPLIKTTEHLIFAVDKSGSGERTLPLLIMPIRSRYICQNRIVLSGNNSVQLVLDEFEMKRVSSIAKDNSTLFRSAGRQKLSPVDDATVRKQILSTGAAAEVINTGAANKGHDAGTDRVINNSGSSTLVSAAAGDSKPAEQVIATMQGFSSQNKPMQQQPMHYGQANRARRLATFEEDASTMLQAKHHANGKSPVRDRIVAALPPRERGCK